MDIKLLEKRFYTHIFEQGLPLVYEIDCPKDSELVYLSFNALRPKEKEIQIFLCFLEKTWSNPIPYMIWGKEFQKSFQHRKSSFAVDLDTIFLKSKEVSRLRVLLEGEVPKGGVQIFCHFASKQFSNTFNEEITIDLPIKGLSQMALNTPLAHRLCSPTSLTACLRYFTNRDLDPVAMAHQVYDAAFDIYGNWALNIAAAYPYLSEMNCFVKKVDSLQEVVESLQKGFPLIMSVQGPLIGAAKPYKQGHLLVLKGIDTQKQLFYCMDPAFETDEQTLVSYPMQDLLRAWERRGYIAYGFQTKN